MLTTLRKKTWEVTAKILIDLGKNVLIAGFASYFFKDLPLSGRLSIAIIGTGLIFMGIYLTEKGDQ